MAYTRYSKPPSSADARGTCRLPVAVHDPNGGAPRGNRNAKVHGRYGAEAGARRAYLASVRAQGRYMTALAKALLAGAPLPPRPPLAQRPGEGAAPVVPRILNPNKV